VTMDETNCVSKSRFVSAWGLSPRFTFDQQKVTTAMEGPFSVQYFLFRTSEFPSILSVTLLNKYCKCLSLLRRAGNSTVPCEEGINFGFDCDVTVYG